MAIKDIKPTPSKPARPVKAASKPAPVAAKPVDVAQLVEKAKPSVPEVLAAPAKKPEPAKAPGPVKTVVGATAKVAEAAKATVQNVAQPVVKAAEKVVETAAETATKTAEAVVAAAPQPSEAGPSQSAQKEIPMTDVKYAADSALNKSQAMFGDMNERAKAAMEKNAKLVEEFNDFAKGNIEAIVESGRIAAKGAETLGQDAAEYGRKSFEQATATLKSLSSAKSPTELFKLQSDYARTAFDAYIAEASKATEQFLKLAGEAVQPLSNRVAVAAEKAKTVA